MPLPLWVPWTIALSLALPVALASLVARGGPGTALSRAALVTMLVPAIAMALFAGWLSLDRLQVTQEELDAAVRDAASSLDGSLGVVDPDRVGSLVADDLGREVRVERSELEVSDELNAGYTLEVRADKGADGPVACLDVGLEVLDARAPDLRLADVEVRSEECG